MTRLTLLLLSLALAACNTASPGFRGIEATVTEVGGNRFQIRQADTLAEVIRTNPTALPKFEVISGQAKTAVLRVTGCEAGWITGDAALMIVGLSCNGAPPPPKPKKPVSTFCDVIDSYRNRGAGLLEITVDCYSL